MAGAMAPSDFRTSALERELVAEPVPFDARFDRCRAMLLAIASRVVGRVDDAAEAVARCRTIAGRNPPAFASEPAFRSWLARVLIDEALAIFQRNGVVDERR
jgi:DNA-directed RNA polymerase specialized sigma24 family protein